jgi:CO/xanthine dehydrogenase FAD-binding subunit
MPATTSRSTFLKLGARAYLVISIAMVAAVVELGSDGRIDTARLVVGACSEVPLHLPALEARMVGRTLAEASDVTVEPTDVAHLTPIDDVRAPATYRREAALVLVRRAIAELAR